MKKTLTLLLTIALGSSLLAQKDFKDLPARTKTKMAQDEQVASEADAKFQSLMTVGFAHFEANRFEEAISSFEEAQSRRPINVYPPVMIADVRLAMEVAAKEMPDEVLEAPEELAEVPVDKTPEITAEERVELMYQQELAKVYAQLPDDTPFEEKKPEPKPEPEVDAEGMLVLENLEEVEVADQATSSAGNHGRPEITPRTEVVLAEAEEPIRSIEEVQEDLAEEYPDGITEKVFEEGNRTITERIVVKDGKGNEYRKVKHGWGGVFYFKNGTSITERIWKEETE